VDTPTQSTEIILFLTCSALNTVYYRYSRLYLR